MSFDPDVTACAALVEKADPDRFLAVMAAPVAARETLFPIYAMNVEVSRAPWVTAEPMIAEMRLQWWRDALAEIAGQGAVRKHEVTTPLARVLSADEAVRLDEYVAVRRWDIYKDPFEDEPHFDAYLEHSSGALLRAAGQSLGEAPEQVLLDLGWAMGLANWFRAVPELEAAGRIPLLDGTGTGVKRLAERGLDRLSRGRKRMREVSVEARPALLAAWQAGPVLRQVAKAPGAVARGEVSLSEGGKRARLMWASATGRV
ncbi:squalene/phytoene synthase family protein [Marinibacterium profundimaris]|uniref:Phytoene synthase n=1 Tax=Marinibacterium profundimaris TaxID=1679460 RepID=A0A225NPA0_9RHOB|nr:squalene/phytoene synthase family protein [Marinibacterium profundimaris]OWU74651.1 phytoene synthase [Marinibacterium profundimaris]